MPSGRPSDAVAQLLLAGRRRGRSGTVTLHLHVGNGRSWHWCSRAYRIKQVGGEFGISEITVKAHRGQVIQKMKAGSLVELVKMSARLPVEAATGSQGALVSCSWRIPDRVAL